MRIPYMTFSPEDKTLIFSYEDIQPTQNKDIWINKNGTLSHTINTNRNGYLEWLDVINEDVQIVIFNENFKNIKPKFTSHWFQGLINLKEIKNLNFLNTDEVEDMRFMFYKCSSLKNIDLSNFNTSKVKNFSYMFSFDESLENLDISSFSNQSVIWENKPFNEFDNGYASMFWGCNNLKTIYIGNSWDETQKVLPMSGWLFADCPVLKGKKGSMPFDPEYDGIYARVDRGLEKPGYFTLREK